MSWWVSSYDYPGYHGISDSLRATVGGPPDLLGRPRHTDFHPLQPRLPDLHRGGPHLQDHRGRKKTVRFDSVREPLDWEPGWEPGWMTIQVRQDRMPSWLLISVVQDLRGEVRAGGRWGGHHSGLLWDRQESQDSTARQPHRPTQYSTVQDRQQTSNYP